MDRTEFSEAFRRILSQNQLGDFAAEETAESFFRLTERMLEVNAHMNLTAITDMDEIILKHYADSLTAAKYLKPGVSIIAIASSLVNVSMRLSLSL